jgi:hypothetical protein
MQASAHRDKAVRSNFLRVAPAFLCITISRRGDPSQKSWRIHGLSVLWSGETPFDPPPALSTQLLISTLPWVKEAVLKVSPLGDFSCLPIRLQRSDDGSMSFATQDDPRHCENEPAELGIALHAPFSLPHPVPKDGRVHFPARMIIFPRCIPWLL